MTPAEFNESIRGTQAILRECQLLRTTAALRSMIGSAEFRELTLTPGTLYRDLYLCGLRNVDYNFLLTDYAYIQFSHFEDHHYRCAFYPNPFSGTGDVFAEELEAALDAGTLSFEEYSEYISDQSYEVRAPLIRFEVDDGSYVMLEHPAAHFHIGMHTENRWAVARELTPRAFALMLSKLYYTREWREHGAMPPDGEGFENRFDRQFAEEKVQCALLATQFFDPKEKALVHLT
jgi:hypothetical protein